uniref:Uncharacterized protein n=1 Tax=Meloidogyne enterolobii TaxID=390850 RepID=A0A6V7VNK3_MELEN|nr:unnamed protein product [Meloidogyne enterolobii]
MLFIPTASDSKQFFSKSSINTHSLANRFICFKAIKNRFLSNQKSFPVHSIISLNSPLIEWLEIIFSN